MNPAQYFTPYADRLEQNGVSESTYEQYMIYQYQYGSYFDHLYNEGGAKEVSKETLTEYLTAHYAIANALSLTTKDSKKQGSVGGGQGSGQGKRRRLCSKA